MAKKKSEPTIEPHEEHADMLIWVEKGGMKLQIHPTTLKSHQEVGWKVCEPPANENLEASEDQAANEETTGEANKDN